MLYSFSIETRCKASHKRVSTYILHLTWIDNLLRFVVVLCKTHSFLLYIKYTQIRIIWADHFRDDTYYWLCARGSWPLRISWLGPGPANCAAVSRLRVSSPRPAHSSHPQCPCLMRHYQFQYIPPAHMWHLSTWTHVTGAWSILLAHYDGLSVISRWWRDLCTPSWNPVAVTASGCEQG